MTIEMYVNHPYGRQGMRYEAAQAAIDGRITDYLYPVLGHGDRIRANALVDAAPYPAPQARADLRSLHDHAVLAPVEETAITVLEPEGFAQVAAEAGTTDAVATTADTYTLGPAGRAYVTDHDLDALRSSLTYVFDDAAPAARF